ncbi:MAG TPA: DNA recombination protein RmuC [Alphaproteobacteria bacterium]|jgi:DNA recombination protein RmuC|nr:DNA recombination protein RmuC [Alphaproteobacteria bacterium]
MGFSIDPLSLVLGAVLGAMVVWLALRNSGAKAAAQAKAVLEQEHAQLADRLAAEFRKLSTDALGQNNRQFLDLARTQFDGFQAAAKGDISQMLQPVRDSLEKVDKQITEIEKERMGAYRGLSVQVEEMAKSNLRLSGETQKLVNAMRNPGVRGRWGELQLRRVIEMAGMQAHVDFAEQASFTVEDGRQRPDVIVKLPGGRTIVIDSKVPFDHYYDAGPEAHGDIAAYDLARQEALQRHARAVRTHMTDLGRKSYWAQFQPSPDFVVMFLPDEGFFSAALRVDPALVEAGIQNHVVPATPTTLIALLRAVEFGWRQEALAENARDISDNAAELYKRLAKFGEHFQKIGRGLTTAIGSYNDAVGSMERQVLPSARRIKELKAAHDNVEIPEPAMIDIAARPVAAPELITAPDKMDVEE